MVAISSPETSVTNQIMVRNNAEGRRNQLGCFLVFKYVGGLISFASTVIFLFTLDISG